MTTVYVLTDKEETNLNKSNRACKEVNEGMGLGSYLKLMQTGNWGGTEDNRPATLRQAFPMYYNVTVPVGGATTLHAAVLLTTVSQTLISFTGAGVVSPARPLLIKGNQATMSGIVTVNGLDIEGNVISENVTLNDATAVSTVRAYSKVTSVVLPAKQNTSDSVSIGTSTNKLGVPSLVYYPAQLMTAILNGTLDSGTITGDLTNVSKCLYTSASTWSGVPIIVVYWL